MRKGQGSQEEVKTRGEKGMVGEEGVAGKSNEEHVGPLPGGRTGGTCWRHLVTSRTV